jgi:hypothetical protein
MLYCFAKSLIQMATPNSTFRPRDEAGDDDREVGGDFCDLDLDLSFRPLVVGVTVTVGRAPTEAAALVDGPLLALMTLPE